MGSDSFTPDHGVLIAKNMGPRADLAPFNWVIDSHPEDIGKIDFIRADGTAVPIGKGDYRQLSDALFHAGTGPGVVSEYVDEANRLHFYVLGTKRDAEGVLSYRVAVRSLDGGGSVHAWRLARAGQRPAGGGRARGRPDVRGHQHRPGRGPDPRASRRAPPGGRPPSGRTCSTCRPAQTVDVPVYVKVPAGAKKPSTLTLTATSETDASKSASSTATVTPAR